MIEIDIMTHGKNITFIIDKVPRGYELHEIDEHCDSWRVGVYESIEAAFARMGHDISKRGGTNA
jgi:hypothetical protein|nr:MAG TPA: hypothetical protein [Caudoviricetes sp.]